MIYADLKSKLKNQLDEKEESEQTETLIVKEFEIDVTAVVKKSKKGHGPREHKKRMYRTKKMKK